MARSAVKKNDLIYRRILIFIHIVLVLVVLTSGSLAGLYYSDPFIHVGTKHSDGTTNTWHLKSTEAGGVLTGGNFTTTISFYNTSIFPITYEPQEADVHYFPIGERPSCMFLHSEDNHFNFLSDNKNILQVFKTLDSTNESFFKLNDLKVTLKSSRWDFANPKYYELKWNIGFEVPSEKLGTVKQIYMDCAKFEKVLFSIHLKENNLNYLFMEKKIKSTFELLVPMNCSIDEKVHKLFYYKERSKEEVLFKDLEHKVLSLD